jgi:exodeoxyribonuclease VII small subunit
VIRRRDVPQRKKQSFEKALGRLEEIAEQLESGELDLDKTVKLLEEGMELARFCTGKLEEVEKKITQLVKKDGGYTLKPIKLEADEERENRS